MKDFDIIRDMVEAQANDIDDMIYLYNDIIDQCANEIHSIYEETRYCSDCDARHSIDTYAVEQKIENLDVRYPSDDGNVYNLETEVEVTYYTCPEGHKIAQYQDFLVKDGKLDMINKY